MTGSAHGKSRHNRDDRSGKPQQQPGARAGTGPASAVAGSASDSVEGRTPQYLLAARYGRPAAADVEQLRAEVQNLPDVKIVSAVAGVEAQTRPAACPPIMVVEASPEQAAELASSGQWLVELDQPLFPPAYAGAGPLTVADPALLPAGTARQVTVVVCDPDKRPVAEAAVYLHGAWPAYGVTDAEGRAVLTVPAGCLDTATALIVTPASGHWSRLIHLPYLSPGTDNMITVQPLSTSFEGFPQRQHVGWSAAALRVDQLPPNYRGHGIKIALIDSGVATDHPEFAGRITHGTNLTNDPAGWNVDPLGTGTACAGIITAVDNDRGITGLALDAQLHAVKATPGGTLTTLLQALDYCIEQRIDLAQINLALPAASQLLAAKLADAHNAGVTVIAPAGDTPGPVTIPAALPEVITVTATGRVGTFPPDSTHAAHLTGWPGPDGDQAAVLTPTGPGVDLAAPGVAILTTAPGGGYTMRDSTTLAAAHITALAALILAHQDDFHTAYPHRGPDRVEHLHQLLLASCRPLGDPARTGAGIPDARRAVWRRRRLDTDWETAVLHQLHLDLTRAGLPPQHS